MSILGGRASVLLGDYWLVKAMENILKGDNSSSTVIRIFARTLSDLAEGELLQLQKAEPCSRNPEKFFASHRVHPVEGPENLLGSRPATTFAS